MKDKIIARVKKIVNHPNVDVAIIAAAVAAAVAILVVV